jgi:SOS-response transcriptional repressor LexA/DNA-binding Xre family transcriptional regulator
LGIHEFIQKLREDRNLSQRRLGELSGISNTEISRIESGERKEVSPLILKAIAPHLGVSYGKLMQVAGYIDTAGNILKKRRESMDIPLEKCAEYSRLPVDTVAKIENNLEAEEVSIEDWVSYGKALNLNRSQVLLIKSYDFMTFNIDHFDRIFTANIVTPNYDEILKNEFVEYIDSYLKPIGKMARIPVLGIIHAGMPIHTEENIIDYEVLPVAEVSDGDYFYLEVTGDSMIEAHILPGSRILVRQQESLKDGEIGVFLIKDEETCVKKIMRSRRSVVLYAANKEYAPQIYDDGDVKIFGKVIKTVIRFE